MNHTVTKDLKFDFNYSDFISKELKKEFKPQLSKIIKSFSTERKMICVASIPISIEEIFEAFGSKQTEFEFTPESFEKACKRAYKNYIKSLKESNTTNKKIQEIWIGKDKQICYSSNIFLEGYAFETKDEFIFRKLSELKQIKEQQKDDENRRKKIELEKKLKLQDLIGSIKNLSKKEKDYVLEQVGDKT